MGFGNTLSKLFKWSNIGTMIFFALNYALISLCLYPYSVTIEGASILLAVYVVTVAISLSPIGEWLLSVFAGAKDIKRKDIQIKLIPLLEIVYGNAKRESPDMVDSIRLKIIPDQGVNAYALGRRTICVTAGLLDLPDDMIMGIFAHEVGHLANRHSEIQLLIGGSNAIISVFLLLLKLISWILTGIAGLTALSSRRFFAGVVIGLLGALSALPIYLWTKICSLFLLWSARSNEFIADEYASRIGFGSELALVLDSCFCEATSHFFKTLYATHPNTDERIARLQAMGASYSRW